MAETLHFPSRPLPDPCKDCSTLLCSECARHGMTAHHFRPDGICPNGHRLDLAGWLTDWIKAEGIEGNYPPDGIASRVAAQVHPSFLERHLAAGGSDYLRHMCRHIKDTADMTDEEWAAENYRHGHDPH